MKEHSTEEGLFLFEKGLTKEEFELLVHEFLEWFHPELHIECIGDMHNLENKPFEEIRQQLMQDKHFLLACKLTGLRPGNELNRLFQQVQDNK